MRKRFFLGLVFLIAILPSAWPAGPMPVSAAAPAPDEPGIVEILFTYGSEKQGWIDAATKKFNGDPPKTISTGERIRVVAKAMGSGEIIEGLREGKSKAHVVSPAAHAFVKLGNAASRKANKGDLINPTFGVPGVYTSLVSSPIVIAMWRDMAETLGWPDKPIGWREFFDLMQKPDNWQRWGPSFRYAHTHPDQSNSGLHALLIEAYAGLGKFYNVTKDDLNDQGQEVSEYIRKVESFVVYYGQSTGFLGKKLQERANRTQRDLHAVILYENLVIEHNQDPKVRAAPILPLPEVVAIYPKEGTFLSDHPIGIVNRDWVGPRQDEAAKLYIKFLLSDEIQADAKNHGFRPGDRDKGPLPVDVFNDKVGVNPKLPEQFLEPPDAAAIEVIQEIWRKNKRPSDIVLAIDISSSMKEGEKLAKVKAAAAKWVKEKTFVDVDTLTIMVFGSEVNWVGDRGALMNEAARERALGIINALEPGGETALYYAIDRAHDFLERRDKQRNRVLVVVSDGANMTGKTVKDPETKKRVEPPTELQILQKVASDARDGSIRVVTIGYGDESNEELLARIAKAAKSPFFKGFPTNIESIFIKVANEF